MTVAPSALTSKSMPASLRVPPMRLNVVAAEPAVEDFLLRQLT